MYFKARIELMVGVFLVAVVFVIILLVAIGAVSVTPPAFSMFELMRRQRSGEKEVDILLKRSKYFADLLSLQRISESVLLVISVVLLVYLCGWFVGVLLGILIALEHGALSRTPFIRTYAQKIYVKYEDTLLTLVEKYPKVFSVFRTLTTKIPETTLSSRDELLHLISESHNILSYEEKQLIKNGLSFDERVVKEVMTPRSVMDVIKKHEMLGPLVLDDLHKTGHNRFPVIDGDLDHVVGILHLRDVLTLDTRRKHTSKVDTAMESRVLYIREDQSLTHALSAFLKTHHHLFIVVNEYRETVGLLSLEDVVETLLGRKIVDEFDAHEDLREVASRNPRKNNSAKNSADV
jgi:putative hemolysin